MDKFWDTDLIHYHGTPITPISVLMTLHGKHFCVSHARPTDVARAHQIGQSVMLDNGAFSKFTKGKATDWNAYYEWCDKWLAYPTTWAIIPDEIDAGTQQQDGLIREWPFKHRGAPVWHLDEPVERVVRLCDEWPRICFGSTAEYWVVGSDGWRRRIDEAFTAISARHRHLPWIHMLRGMQCCEWGYPFASVDSTDVAQNHASRHRTAREMVDKWDAQNGPLGWKKMPIQMELIA